MGRQRDKSAPAGIRNITDGGDSKGKYGSRSLVGASLPDSRWFRFGRCTLEGPRHSNEDRLVVDSDREMNIKGGGVVLISVYAVIDGHGGSIAANYIEAHLSECVQRAIGEYARPSDGPPWIVGKSIEKALRKAALDLEDGVLLATSQREDFSGACMFALVSVLVPGHGAKPELFSLSIGDCRAVIVERDRNARNGVKVYPMNLEHTPARESKRIETTGGSIMCARVFGVLAMSRTIGDREFKRSLSAPCNLDSSATGSSLQTSQQTVSNASVMNEHGYPVGVVIAEPDIATHALSSKFLMIALATDGLWDCVTNLQVATSFAEFESSGGTSAQGSIDQLALNLCNMSRQRGSEDDISILILTPTSELRSRLRVKAFDKST